MPDTLPEDNAHVREVVLERMAEEYPTPEPLEAAMAEEGESWENGSIAG